MSGSEAGGVQLLDILRFAGGGPDMVAGISEGVGQGAADAAGTTGDQDGGHGWGLLSGDWFFPVLASSRVNPLPQSPHRI
ncbi:protein of unknown function [Pseudomonas sp. JV551A1]|uniref:Uncharacterized protein n=1 Tax=Pseudomonas inefficax TaxID=2078786 RepID=A0AAQ1PE78_9PSED|nr:protein of unknown function [Pseudomonas sp. JV551A1]SPO63579.1 protein of unknown function [Pseudomonas inefficax]